MGLLEKATKISSRSESSEKMKSSGNIPSSNEAILSDSLLKSAESAEDGEKSAVNSDEEDKKGGLMAKAEALKERIEAVNEEEEVLKTAISEEGLLKKAEDLFKQEQISIEGSEAQTLGLLERAEKTLKETTEELKEPTGLMEEAQKFIKEPEEKVTPEVLEEIETVGKGEAAKKISEKEEVSEELFSEGKMIEEEISKEEVSKIEKEVMEAVPPEVKKEEAEAEEAKFEEEVPSKIDYLVLLKKSVMSENIAEAIKVMDLILSEEDFIKLGEVILDILISITEGEAGVIFELFDDVFTPSIFDSQMDKNLKKKYKILRSRIKKSEKLTSTLMRIEDPVSSKDKKAGLIYESIKGINEINSWLLIPFISHNVVYGFALIVNINEKKHLLRKAIKLLMMVFKDKLALEILENRIIERENEITVFKEYQKLLTTVKENLLEKKIDISLSFKSFCSSLSIEIASLMVNNLRGREILAVTGMTQESIIRYNVLKVRSKIYKYINKKKAVLVKDVKASQFGLAGEDLKKADILVLVPILYQGDIQGVLIIHKFKHKVKKLTNELILKLNSSSQFLLPLILSYRLNSVNPVELIIKKIEEKIKWSDKSKRELVFFRVKLNRVYESIQKVSLKRYLSFLSEIDSIIQKIAENNIEITFLFPDIIALLAEEDAIEIDSFKIKLEEKLKGLIKRQKLLKNITVRTDISTYPDKMKDFSTVFNFLSSGR